MNKILAGIILITIYSNLFSQEIIHILEHPINRKFHYIDKNGETKFIADTDNDFVEDLAYFEIYNDKNGFIDKTGNVVINLDNYTKAKGFSYGYAAIYKNNKWGFIDKSGKIVIEPKYETAGSFSDNLAPVSVNKKYGYINTKGKLVINTKYDYAGDFKNGYAWIAKKENYQYTYAIINADGKEITGFEFYNRQMFPDPPKFINELIWTEIKTDDYLYDRVLVNSKGKIIKRLSGLRNMRPFHNGIAVVQSDVDGRYYYINQHGEKINNKTYEWANDFSDEMAMVKESYSGKTGYLKPDGTYAIEHILESGGDFKDGMAVVKKNEKWSIIDKTGKVILSPDYRPVSHFNDGLARIKKSGKYGYINKAGTLIITNKYQAALDFKNGIAKVGSYSPDSTLSDWATWHYINTKDEIFWNPENEFTEKSQIIIPDNYNPKQQYNVLIALPFTGGSAKNHIGEYINNLYSKEKSKEGLTSFLKEVFPENRDKDFIIIITPGTGSSRDHDWQGFSNAIERYNNKINQDLIELTEKYNINPSGIFLTGFSLGGDLAWALSLKNPDKYKGAIICGSRCSYSQKGSFTKLAKKNARFYIGMGEMEQAVRLKGAKYAKSLLDKNGIKSIYYTIPKGGHTSLSKIEFINALQFIMNN